MNQFMPLAMVSTGEAVQVVDIRGGCGIQRRLADLGLTPAVNIRIVNGQMPGPVIIDLRGSRLAIGHGMAHKILVKEVI